MRLARVDKLGNGNKGRRPRSKRVSEARKSKDHLDSVLLAKSFQNLDASKRSC